MAKQPNAKLVILQLERKVKELTQQLDIAEQFSAQHDARMNEAARIAQEQIARLREAGQEVEANARDRVNAVIEQHKQTVRHLDVECALKVNKYRNAVRASLAFNVVVVVISALVWGVI